MCKYFILTPFFPSENSFRGSYILDQSKAIKRNSKYDLNVIILSSLYHKSNGNYVIDGINCFTFKIFDLPSFIFPGLFNFINQIRFNRFLIKNNLKINNNSIVHGHITYPSLCYIKFIYNKVKCKTILQHHGLDILQFQTGLKIPFLKNLQNSILKKRFVNSSSYVKLHIAVSNIVKSKIIEINNLIENDIYICINGVDTSKFYQEKNPIKNNSFTIGCVANFWKLKDQISLLKAVAILNNKGIKNIRVEFVGDGVTKKMCEKFAIKNNIDCKFIKDIKHNKLRSFYNKLNLFVLPSYFEAFGCVYLEALACNVPFIGVVKQGIESIIPIEHRHNHLVNPKSPIDLSNMILYFYKNKSEFRFYENLNIENTVSKMLSHINTI